MTITRSAGPAPPAGASRRCWGDRAHPGANTHGRIRALRHGPPARACAIDTSPQSDVSKMRRAEGATFDVLERELGRLAFPGARVERRPINPAIRHHPHYSLLHLTKTAERPDGLSPEEAYAGRSNLVYVVPGSSPAPPILGDGAQRPYRCDRALLPAPPGGRRRARPRRLRRQRGRGGDSGGLAGDLRRVHRLGTPTQRKHRGDVRHRGGAGRKRLPFSRRRSRAEVALRQRPGRRVYGRPGSSGQPRGGVVSGAAHTCGARPASRCLPS